MKKQKIISMIMALAIVVSMFLSFMFIAASCHHDCIGEDCPICQEIQNAENVVSKIVFAIAITMFLFGLCISAHLFNSNYVCERLETTPVKLKVCLLN